MHVKWYFEANLTYKMVHWGIFVFIKKVDYNTFFSQRIIYEIVHVNIYTYRFNKYFGIWIYLVYCTIV